MTVFDEVGYYTSPGMGVMAAQARSLGFSLIFAGQDMPALQKRVKEEALSITGNCNLKIFGKLEDPTETKDFFEKTVASAMVSEVSGFSASQGISGRTYSEGDNITFQAKKEASYDDLRRQREGQVHFLWADRVVAANMFHASPPRVEAVRVQRFLGVSPRNWSVEARDKAISEVINHLRDRSGQTPPSPPAQPVQEIQWMVEGYKSAESARQGGEICAAVAVANITVGLKKQATEVVPPSLGTASPGGGQGYWPFGAATGIPGQPPQPGAVPPPVAPTASTPPWMTGTQPASQAGPPPTSPSAPPWAAQGQGGGASPPPPWTAPAARPPMPPPQVQQPPYGAPVQQQGGNASGQPLSWGSVMGGAAGMSTSPGGARVAQAPTAPPPPSWMITPPGSAPPQSAPPPWAGGAQVPPPPPAPPAWQQMPPQQRQAFAPPPMPPQAPYAPPPMQQQPQQQPAPFMPPPPAQPQQAQPALPPADGGEIAPDVEAILRNAADNLSGEMFPDGQTPKGDDTGRQG
jgi:intracellular multiplication protein IcmO